MDQILFSLLFILICIVVYFLHLYLKLTRSKLKTEVEDEFYPHVSSFEQPRPTLFPHDHLRLRQHTIEIPYLPRPQPPPISIKKSPIPLPYNQTLVNHNKTPDLIDNDEPTKQIYSYSIKGSKPLVNLNRIRLLQEGVAQQQNIETISILPPLPTSIASLPSNSIQIPPVKSNPSSFSSFLNIIPPSDLVLHSVLGGGAFGQVWRGEWRGTPVGVKVLSPPCQTPASLPLLQAFEEEALILSRLRHPNICLFLGLCTQAPHRGIVTELVARGSLWSALRDSVLTMALRGASHPSPHPHQDSLLPCLALNQLDTALPPSPSPLYNLQPPPLPLPLPHNLPKPQNRILSPSPSPPSPVPTPSPSVPFHWPVWAIRRVLEGTARGLAYLHSQHPSPLIHRDMKSANLLLDESLNVKICDFGLARIRDFTAQMTANVGTVQWMAPEVLTGGSYSESADVYSLGVVAWELVTGLCPYEGRGPLEVAISVSHRGERPPLPPSLSSRQMIFIQSCWSQDPALRPASSLLLSEIDAAFPLPLPVSLPPLLPFK